MVNFLEKIMAKYTSLQERLTKLSCSCSLGWYTPCKLWDGYTQKDGYVSDKEGYGKINLMREGRSLKFTVHRVAKVLEEILSIHTSFDFYRKVDRALFFDLYDAYLLSGLTIDHLCKNSLCIECDHLEWVYNSVNQKRKKWARKKRSERIHLNHSKNTRHHRLVNRSKTVHELIIKIKKRGFRRIT